MKFVVLALMAALLMGCTQLKSGKVVGKEFIPMHTESSSTVMYIGNSVTILPTTETVPDRYYLAIEGKHDGKVIREWHSVEEWTYEGINIGDQWSISQ